MKRTYLYCEKCSESILIKQDDEWIEPCQHLNGSEEAPTKRPDFKPFYNEEVKTMITSPAQMDRVYKQHGLRPIGDLPKASKDKMKQILKHKEEYTASKYAAEGKKYVPGSNSRWSDRHQDFIPKVKWESMKRAGMIVLLLAFSAPAFAETVDMSSIVDANGHFIGVDYTKLTVNGVTYDVPIGNPDRKQELYLLKKALKGDTDSLEMFLGGEPQRFYMIGDTKMTWLLARKDGVFEVRTV